MSKWSKYCRKQKQQKQKKGAKDQRKVPTYLGVCRDCGADREMFKFEFFRTTAPRCYQCGGMLDMKRQSKPHASTHRPA